MTRPPLIQRPVYLSGASPPPVPEAVQDVCRKAAPIAGLLGATAVGVTAAYFGPKFFDWALGRWRASEAGGHGSDVEFEVEE